MQDYLQYSTRHTEVLISFVMDDDIKLSFFYISYKVSLACKIQNKYEIMETWGTC
jgi:hypothetical protein